MLGIKEVDRLVKPKGLVLIESETSFPYEAVLRKLLADKTLVYLDGPKSLGEKLFGKKPIGREFFEHLLRGEKPEKPVIASLTPLYYKPDIAKLSQPEDLLFTLAHLREAYSDSIAIARLHFDAVPEKFSNLLEIQADIVLRMHPMGPKAVAIVRRHPRPSVIGDTVEFGVRYDPGAYRGCTRGS